LLSVSVEPGAVLAFAGIVTAMVFHREKIRQTGYLVLGVGMLFTGMQLMTQAMAPLRASEHFTSLMMGLDFPLLAMLLGAGVAAVLQSSAATIGMAQALAVQGLMPLQTAFFIIMGANVGTCLTALISVSGASVNARRAACIHLLFNVIGAAMFFAAMQLLPLTAWLELAGDHMKLKVALAHVGLNVAATVVLLPLASLLTGLSRLFVRSSDAMEDCRLQCYDERLLATPALALSQLGLEVQRLVKTNMEQLSLAIDCWQGDCDEDAAGKMASYEKECAFAEKAVLEACVQVQARTCGVQDGRRVGILTSAATNSRRIAGYAAHLFELAEKGRGEQLSEEALDELTCFAHQAHGLLEVAGRQLSGKRLSPEEMQSAMLMLKDVEKSAQNLHDRQIQRLQEEKCTSDSSVAYLEAVQDVRLIVSETAEILGQKQ